MKKKAIEVENTDRLTPPSSAMEQEVVKPKNEDYLRKYQYKKVNDRIQVGGELTDPDKGSKAEIMKKHLLTQPKTRVLIQVKAGSDPSVPFTVTLNGYRLDFPRNNYLEVPEQIADIIMNSQKQTIDALNQFRFDGNKSKEDALR